MSDVETGFNVPHVVPVAVPMAIPMPGVQMGRPIDLAYADFGSIAGQGVWRQGKLVVQHINATLPHRCIRCNAPAEEVMMRRTLYWHHPAIYLSILAGIIVYIIVAIIVRKKAVVFIGLCPRHMAHRRWAIVSVVLGLAALAAGIFMAINNRDPMWVAIGTAGLLTGLFTYLGLNSPIVPKRIDDYFVWFKGAGKPFLKSLPVAVS